MKVAVTGATGHLGANLVRALLEQGRAVRAVTVEPADVVPRALEGLGVERVSADITDARSVDAALLGADVVYHLAARISVVDWDADAVWATNVDGTRNVVNACVTNEVRRLIHVSSYHAIAPQPRMAVVDGGPPSVDPSLPIYARSKAAGERVVRDAVRRGLDAVVVNPTGMLGPYDFGPSMFGRMLIDLWRGKLPAVVSGGVNLVDVRDMATTLLAAERSGRAGRSYLVGGHWMSLIELAELSATLLGTRVPRFVTPMWMARAAANVATAVGRIRGRTPRLTDQSLVALVQHRLVLGDRAMDELGHRPRPIERTLVDTYEWFAECGMLTNELAAV